MSVPTVATYSPAALIAAHTALLVLLNGGSVKVRSATDALLATLSLPNPAGTINGTTGSLSLSASSGTVAADGTAAYGELCQADGTVLLSLPASSSSVAIPGRLALNSTTLLVGAGIDLLPSVLG